MADIIFPERGRDRLSTAQIFVASWKLSVYHQNVFLHPGLEKVLQPYDSQRCASSRPVNCRHIAVRLGIQGVDK